MARNLNIFCDWTLVSFFRKSTKRWPRLDFWGVKNAWKSDENYAFWRAPRTIHRPRPAFQTDAQNHATWHQNVFKITAKWPQKNGPRFCKKLSKTHVVAWPAKMHQIAFISVVPGVALLTPWTPKSLKIIENSLQVIDKSLKTLRNSKKILGNHKQNMKIIEKH